MQEQILVTLEYNSNEGAEMLSHNYNGRKDNCCDINHDGDSTQRSDSTVATGMLGISDSRSVSLGGLPMRVGGTLHNSRGKLGLPQDDGEFYGFVEQNVTLPG